MSCQRSAQKGWLIGLTFCLLAGGASLAVAAKPGDQIPRRGDEIVVCGQLFHTTAPVVLWMDPGGYDAYRVERRFSPYERSSWKDSKEDVPALDSPNRYGLREKSLSKEEIELVRGGGWTLEQAQDVVDQFVLHYDVCGNSQRCFKVLQDMRCLSVHFLLDVDGTIYQTLDLKERAWHATISNTRSIGIEIAQMGAYPPDKKSILDRWYTQQPDGQVILKLPADLKKVGIRTPSFVGHPERPGLITGTIHGRDLCQYDFTPEQYDSLIKLTATLCQVFPKLQCDYPRDENGQLLNRKLSENEWRDYQGLLGHFHIQLNKVDPGPAMNWDKLINGARELMK